MVKISYLGKIIGGIFICLVLLYIYYLLTDNIEGYRPNRGEQGRTTERLNLTKQLEGIVDSVLPSQFDKTYLVNGFGGYKYVPSNDDLQIFGAICDFDINSEISAENDPKIYYNIFMKNLSSIEGFSLTLGKELNYYKNNKLCEFAGIEAIYNTEQGEQNLLLPMSDEGDKYFTRFFKTKLREFLVATQFTTQYQTENIIAQHVEVLANMSDYVKETVQSKLFLPLESRLENGFTVEDLSVENRAYQLDSFFSSIDPDSEVYDSSFSLFVNDIAEVLENEPSFKDVYALEKQQVNFTSPNGTDYMTSDVTLYNTAYREFVIAKRLLNESVLKLSNITLYIKHNNYLQFDYLYNIFKLFNIALMTKNRNALLYAIHVKEILYAMVIEELNDNYYLLLTNEDRIHTSYLSRKQLIDDFVYSAYVHIIHKYTSLTYEFTTNFSLISTYQYNVSHKYDITINYLDGTASIDKKNYNNEMKLDHILKPLENMSIPELKREIALISELQAYFEMAEEGREEDNSKESIELFRKKQFAICKRITAESNLEEGTIKKNLINAINNNGRQSILQYTENIGIFRSDTTTPSDTNAYTAMGPNTDTAMGPYAYTAMAPYADTAMGPNTGTAMGPNADTYTGPNAGTYTGPYTNTYTGPNAGTYTGPYTNTYTAPNAGTAMGPNAGTAMGPNTDTDKGANAKKSTITKQEAARLAKQTFPEKREISGFTTYSEGFSKFSEGFSPFENKKEGFSIGRGRGGRGGRGWGTLREGMQGGTGGRGGRGGGRGGRGGGAPPAVPVKRDPSKLKEAVEGVLQVAQAQSRMAGDKLPAPPGGEKPTADVEGQYGKLNVVESPRSFMETSVYSQLSNHDRNKRDGELNLARKQMEKQRIRNEQKAESGGRTDLRAASDSAGNMGAGQTPDGYEEVDPLPAALTEASEPFRVAAAQSGAYDTPAYPPADSEGQVESNFRLDEGGGVAERVAGDGAGGYVEPQMRGGQGGQDGSSLGGTGDAAGALTYAELALSGSGQGQGLQGGGADAVQYTSMSNETAVVTPAGPPNADTVEGVAVTMVAELSPAVNATTGATLKSILQSGIEGVGTVASATGGVLRSGAKRGAKIIGTAFSAGGKGIKKVLRKEGSSQMESGPPLPARNPTDRGGRTEGFADPADAVNVAEQHAQDASEIKMEIVYDSGVQASVTDTGEGAAAGHAGQAAASSSGSKSSVADVATLKETQETGGKVREGVAEASAAGGKAIPPAEAVQYSTVNKGPKATNENVSPAAKEGTNGEQRNMESVLLKAGKEGVNIRTQERVTQFRQITDAEGNNSYESVGETKTELDQYENVVTQVGEGGRAKFEALSKAGAEGFDIPPEVTYADPRGEDGYSPEMVNEMMQTLEDIQQQVEGGEDPAVGTTNEPTYVNSEDLSEPLPELPIGKDKSDPENARQDVREITQYKAEMKQYENVTLEGNMLDAQSQVVETRKAESAARKRFETIDIKVPEGLQKSDVVSELVGGKVLDQPFERRISELNQKIEKFEKAGAVTEVQSPRGQSGRDNKAGELFNKGDSLSDAIGRSESELAVMNNATRENGQNYQMGSGEKERGLEYLDGKINEAIKLKVAEENAKPEGEARMTTREIVELVIKGPKEGGSGGEGEGILTDAISRVKEIANSERGAELKRAKPEGWPEVKLQNSEQTRASAFIEKAIDAKVTHIETIKSLQRAKTEVGIQKNQIEKTAEGLITIRSLAERSGRVTLIEKAQEFNRFQREVMDRMTEILADIPMRGSEAGAARENRGGGEIIRTMAEAITNAARSNEAFSGEAGLDGEPVLDMDVAALLDAHTSQRIENVGLSDKFNKSLELLFQAAAEADANYGGEILKKKAAQATSDLLDCLGPKEFDPVPHLKTGSKNVKKSVDDFKAEIERAEGQAVEYRRSEYITRQQEIEAGVSQLIEQPVERPVGAQKFEVGGNIGGTELNRWELRKPGNGEGGTDPLQSELPGSGNTIDMVGNFEGLGVSDLGGIRVESNAANGRFEGFTQVEGTNDPIDPIDVVNSDALGSGNQVETGVESGVDFDPVGGGSTYTGELGSGNLGEVTMPEIPSGFREF